MRLLQIITQKPFSTGSGMYLAGLLKELGKSHPQHLICGLSQGEELGLVPTDMPLTADPVFFSSLELPFPVPGMSDVMPYESSRYSELTDEQTAVFLKAFRVKIEEALLSFSPDLILFQHLYLLTGEMVSWLKETGSAIPLVGFCHGSELRQLRNTDRWRQSIHEGIRRLDFVITTHPEQGEEIQATYGIEKERIRILGSGFDSDIFYADPQEIKPQREHDPLQIVFTGKISRAKGVPELIRACSSVHQEIPLHLTLIGSGADPKEMEAIQTAAREGICPVRFAGQLPQQKIAQIYRQSDIFVLPSFYEGMPLVVPEALACGLSVAVTDLPGFAEWLRPFSGKVALIPRPEMASSDEPTQQGREDFIRDIAKALRRFAQGPGQGTVPDMTDYSWAGLTLRLEELLVRLTNE